MEVIVVLVLISLIFVVAALLLLFSSLSRGDLDHGDRLTLLPLERDERPDPSLTPPSGGDAT